MSANCTGDPTKRMDAMPKELEIVTPNLRGACIEIDNRIEGLFKLTNRNRGVADNAWLQVRPAARREQAVKDR